MVEVSVALDSEMKNARARGRFFGFSACFYSSKYEGNSRSIWRKFNSFGSSVLRQK